MRLRNELKHRAAGAPSVNEVTSARAFIFLSSLPLRRITSRDAAGRAYKLWRFHSTDWRNSIFLK